MTLFMLVSVLFFILGRKNENNYFLCGIFLGCAMLTKYPGVLVLPVILIFTALYKPELFKLKKFHAIYVSAFAIFLPWIIWNVSIYGSFWSNLGLHKDTSFMGSFLSITQNKAFVLLIFLVVAGISFMAYKGYFAKAIQTVMKKKVVGFSLAGLILLLLFSLEGVRTGFLQSLFLNKLPPVSNMYPSVFAKEPWFFYLGQLLKMSPIFIFSYISIFFFNSKKDGDKLLLLSVFVILLFYIKWGNYQSRYILSAVPFLMILASRMFFWLWDGIATIKNKLASNSLRYITIGLLTYFIIKTILVDAKVASVLSLDGYFTYF